MDEYTYLEQKTRDDKINGWLALLGIGLLVVTCIFLVLTFVSVVAG